MEKPRIGFEIVRYVVLGGKCVSPSRKRHTGQAGIARRIKQAERVPTVPPRVSDALAGIEDLERDSSFCQMVADGEPGLAAADHNGLNLS